MFDSSWLKFVPHFALRLQAENPLRVIATCVSNRRCDCSSYVPSSPARYLISAPGKSKCTAAALCVVATALVQSCVLPRWTKQVGAVPSDLSSNTVSNQQWESRRVKPSVTQLVLGSQRHRAQEGRIQTQII